MIFSFVELQAKHDKLLARNADLEDQITLLKADRSAQHELLSLPEVANILDAWEVLRELRCLLTRPRVTDLIDRPMLLDPIPSTGITKQ